MASFRQRNNKWQARVSRDGYPDQVKTFEARTDAERWARSVESAMDKRQFINSQEAQRTTLRELILRYIQEVTAQHTQGNQGTQEDQDAQGIQENQGNQHFKTGNQCWFKGSCEQFKRQALTSLYEGVKLWQTTLLLEQQAGVSPAFNATPSQRELVSNATPRPQRVNRNAASMEALQLAPIQNKADNVARKLKPFMAMKRAKREPNALKVCVGYASWKTLAMR